jgi:hypothetical protein
MTRPLEWMAAVRDHPKRPPAAQVHALLLLALRMDWKTGCGFASMLQLAEDAESHRSTVWRATRWARDAELLVQTRRGHRVGDGTALSSEWRLTIPQRCTGETLGDSSMLQQPDLNVAEDPSQRRTGATPSRTSSSRTSPSARASASAEGARSGAAPQTCDRDGDGPHSDACRKGQSARCGMDWCRCACHGRPA